MFTLNRILDPVVHAAPVPVQPYTNYPAVARRFGSRFADLLARYPEETREKVIFRLCQWIETRRQRRRIEIDVETGLVLEVAGEAVPLLIAGRLG